MVASYRSGRDTSPRGSKLLPTADQANTTARTRPRTSHGLHVCIPNISPLCDASGGVDDHARDVSAPTEISGTWAFLRRKSKLCPYFFTERAGSIEIKKLIRNRPYPSTGRSFSWRLGIRTAAGRGRGSEHESRYYRGQHNTLPGPPQASRTGTSRDSGSGLPAEILQAT